MSQSRTQLFKAMASALFVSAAFNLAAADTPAEADETAGRVTQLEQDDAQESSGVVEEVITTGTRSSRPRTAADSPVPIDVLSGDAFDAFGGTNDVTDNLKALVPSYTATPLTGDGSAFVRPTSLRGTAPDQTLVLVDGKRRHRSALLHFFAPAAGNGAHGVDIGMIPGIAIKRVEVLRDGASSQYGSDAIAGVINFITKDADSGGETFLQYGSSFESEDSMRFGANAGFSVGDGFVNVSLEHIDNEAFIRAVQRQSDIDELLDLGVNPALFGADAPFGEAPLLQTWGRPESDGTRIWINSGWDVGNDKHFYARVGYADTFGRYRFFYRTWDHASLAPLRDMGFTGLPAGYTPYLDGEQEDISLVAGLEGILGNETTWDFSVGFGRNELDYFLNNTVNTSLGLDANLNIPQMDFNVGAFEQEEVNIGIDFSKPLNDRMNLAYGFEWREETYTLVPGEPSAYLGVGTSGFSSPTPRDAGSFDRDNWAVYADMEHDVSDELLLQYALRYEDFSDFGDTLNGKLAGRYRVNDRFALRGAISTGFHAPTPGQKNISTIITTFDGTTGMQVEEGLVPSTDPRAEALGGGPLTEETSTNYSIGFTSDVGDASTLTVDFYKIEVDDRIYRTGNIPLPPLPSGLETSISFYTNALDVEHSGIDLVFTTAFDWSGGADTRMTFAYSYNEIDVTGQKLINNQQPVGDDLIEDIENNYPEHRFVLTTNTSFNDKTNLLVRVNYYGDHYDERGRIGAATDPSLKIGATTFVDVELGYQWSDNFKLALGAVNILDEYPDKAGPPFANRLSVGLEYPRRSAANYEGGQWYLRGTYTW
ncbi:MAG: TonB-dependent receptor [Xanthomonadales bacterium]|nr:TonB-dependent receptor [Xanthomonadales bacterium]